VRARDWLFVIRESLVLRECLMWGQAPSPVHSQRRPRGADTAGGGCATCQGFRHFDARASLFCARLERVLGLPMMPDARRANEVVYPRIARTGGVLIKSCVTEFPPMSIPGPVGDPGRTQGTGDRTPVCLPADGLTRGFYSRTIIHIEVGCGCGSLRGMVPLC